MDYSGKIIKKTPVVPSQQSASGVWSLDEAMQAQRSNTWPVANVPNPISRSLRFRSSASAYLNRTPSVAGNRKTWTWSGWVKFGDVTASARPLFGTLVTSDYTLIGINASGQGTVSIGLESITGTVTGIGRAWTNAVFRDPSAWYHVVCVLDTTQATGSDRFKIYINGVQQTLTFNTTPTLNQDHYVNQSGVSHGTMSAYSTAYVNDGYLAENHFIDGQALTPSSFGGTNAVTGVWEPRQYTGTYGTNGFYLNFKDNTSTSTLGLDYSGNNNTWTTNNISVTAGSTYDSMLDVPTQWIGYNTGDVASVTRGNYCVFNPLDAGSGATTSNGNLTVSTGTPTASIRGTIGITSGKFYWECQATALGNGMAFGVFGANANLNDWTAIISGITYGNNGSKNINGSETAYGASYTTSDIIGVAVDADAGSVTFYKNNTSQGSLSTIPNPCFASFTDGSGGASASGNINFGQRPFSYTPPAGFLSLCTTNLPSPTILQGNQYFDALTWTGNGSNPRSFTGLNFAPDFVWAKNRSVAYTHSLYDVLRGAGANKELISASTSAEGGGNQDEFGYLSSFDSAGFTSAAGSSGQNYYFNDVTYPAFVAWNWKANGAGVTNNAGSITSTVSANTTAGFSIVTYTGTGSAATVGHGLGVAPSFLIFKNRSGTDGWIVFTQAITATTWWDTRLLLASTAAAASGAGYLTSAPTSTLLTLSGSTPVNASSNNYVCYAFAEVAGYSAFGSYTGNGSTDGPFVYTGFRPKWIMIKNASNGIQSWNITDTSRSTFNVSNAYLVPNQADAEGTSGYANMDILSNGFKLRIGDAFVNGSGNTMIYMAFAENPFKNALAR